jgi:hypothetical protein
MLHKLSRAGFALLLAASAASAATVALQPIPDAFARLGHSCGGIKQQIYGEGFDSAGRVTGHVFATTRCGGSGRGGGYRTTTYSTWVAVTWALDGAVVAEAPGVPDPDPSVAGAYHSGSLVGGSNYPVCDNLTPYDNAFTCMSPPAVDATNSHSVQTSLYVVNQAACQASDTTYCTYRAAVTSCDTVCVQCGDADGSGTISASDALAALRSAIGVASCALLACDVNGSGDITAADALRILEYAVDQNVGLGCSP